MIFLSNDEMGGSTAGGIGEILPCFEEQLCTLSNTTGDFLPCAPERFLRAPDRRFWRRHHGQKHGQEAGWSTLNADPERRKSRFLVPLFQPTQRGPGTPLQSCL